MALRALTTFFHEALGSDWSQASMAVSKRTSSALSSPILFRTENSISSWTPNFTVSDHVRSSSSRDRSGSFGLASAIAPTPSPSRSFYLLVPLSLFVSISLSLSLFRSDSSAGACSFAVHVPSSRLASSVEQVRPFFPAESRDYCVRVRMRNSHHTTCDLSEPAGRERGKTV